MFPGSQKSLKKFYTYKFDDLKVLKKVLENHYLPNLTKTKYITWTAKTIKNNFKLPPRKEISRLRHFQRRISLNIKEELWPTLNHLIVKIKEKGTLANYFMRWVFPWYQNRQKIVPKEEKRKAKESYRTISLMNIDTKLLKNIKSSKIYQ